MKRILVASFLIVSLAGCTGGGGGGTSYTAPVPQPTASPAPVTPGLVPTSFTITIPLAGSSTTRQPSYVSPNTLSVNITLNTVNGNPPAGGLTTSVTTNIASGSCNAGCTIPGPNTPVGTDNFTITTYSAINAGGSPLSTLTQSYSVVQGTNNALSGTLKGIPSTFSITSVPSGTAGTAFGSPATLTVTVKDASGNTITGTYNTAVGLADSDVSSLTQGTALTVNAGSATTSATINASSDVVKLNYGGLAIAPATLTASASGATNATATFTPTLQSIVYTGPLTGGNDEIDLFATSGAGSTGTFTLTEVGWTNAPYSKAWTYTTPGCSSIATLSPASGVAGTSFTVTAVGSPVAGSCGTTFQDGAAQTSIVELTYTTSGFTINGAHHKTQ